MLRYTPAIGNQALRTPKSQSFQGVTPEQAYTKM